MMIPVACQSCGRKAHVPDDAIGRLAACPACNARHRLEAAGEPIIPPPAAVTERSPAFPDPSPARPLRVIPDEPT